MEDNMPRAVNDTQPYQDKLVKLIPTEIVGAYMVLAGFLGFSPATTSALVSLTATSPISDIELKKTLIQIVFVILLILTPIYLWKVSKVTNGIQLLITTFSYVVWVYTLGGPFTVWGIYYVVVGSVALVLWSLIAPLFFSPKSE
jgi:hypothetical protein